MNYENYLNSNDWKLKRAKKRSGHKNCAICGSVSDLQVHHLNYKDLYSVKQSDLRVLCGRCHRLAHELFKQGKYKFRNDNHGARYVITKAAVKKYLGLTGKNLFS